MTGINKKSVANGTSPAICCQTFVCSDDIKYNKSWCVVAVYGIKRAGEPRYLPMTSSG
uniref:Uncharacterized protein n=1 Tax=Yersinia enterocolitica W22703 TaxID=913028 RepID=F4MVR9_YEREN|nr:unknown protein [Yersinia enterocolitica W22703]